MKIRREEIRTGLLVVLTLGVFVSLLIYLGAPGTFVPQKSYWIYFDNAAGLRPGAQVLLAGRKIGQVRGLFSPVPEKERPTPRMEALIEVRVEAAAPVYQRVQVSLVQPRLLSDPVIDFTHGEETSGLAPDGQRFLGERPSGLSEMVPAVLERLDPALQKISATLDSLQGVSDNLRNLTDENADLPVAFSQLKTFTLQLNEMTSRESPLRRSLSNLEALTGPEGKISLTFDHLTKLTSPQSSLAKSLSNAERFTGRLSQNSDLDSTLRNFRRLSEKLDGTAEGLDQQLGQIANNLEQATDTVKRQPWRLIWPTTKKYEPTTKPPPAAPVARAPRKSPRVVGERLRHSR